MCKLLSCLANVLNSLQSFIVKQNPFDLCTFFMHTNCKSDLAELFTTFYKIIYRKTSHYCPNFQTILNHDSYKLLSIQFMVILHFLNYVTDNKCYNYFYPLAFLMHYRGLSLNGFYHLHQTGLSPSVTTITKLMTRTQNILPETKEEYSILWMDNLRRQLKGNFPSSMQVDWTVVGGIINLPFPPKINEDKLCVGDYFTTENLLQLNDFFYGMINIDLNNSKYYFANLDYLSVPLRKKNAKKFRFVEHDILPFKIGTVVGTINATAHLIKNHFSDIDTYKVLVVDYDIFWRLHKLLFSISITSSFPTIRKKMILIQGPWHVYKTFCNAIWDCYSNILIADIWLNTFKKPVPNDPDLADQLYFMIFFAFCVKLQKEKWEPKTKFGTFVSLLLYELVPLLINFGMSIQLNNIFTYYELLPLVTTWFIILGNTNYANSCEISLLQWIYWNKTQHPILPWLTDNFKGTSEEYGEAAIHTLMTHVREWNYSGDNLKKRWLESKIANYCFEYLHIKRARKESGTKYYYINSIDIKMSEAAKLLTDIVIDIDNRDYYYFVKSNKGYKSNSQTISCNRWIDGKQILENHNNRVNLVLLHAVKIERKIKKPIDKQTFAQFELETYDLVYS